MIYFEFGKFQVAFLLALCLATCDAAVIEVTAGGEGIRYEPTYQFSDEEGTKLATLVASGTNITSSVDLVTNNVSLNDLGTRLAATETSLNDYATRLAAKEATITSLANIVVQNFGQYSLPQNISISLAAMNAGLDAMNGLPSAICSIASVGKSIQTNYGSVGWKGFTGLTVAECLAKVGTSEGANGGTIDYAVYGCYDGGCIGTAGYEARGGYCGTYTEYKPAYTGNHAPWLSPIYGAAYRCACGSGCS